MDFIEIGNYGLDSADDYGKNVIAGHKDDFVSCDGCIAWGGGGDDVLEGEEKGWRPPILLGGKGNDEYRRESLNDFVIVADLQGGSDTLRLSRVSSAKIDVYKLRDKDFLIYRADDVTGVKYPAALLIDPLGNDSKKHRIETFVFSDNTFGFSKFRKYLKNRIAGEFSYEEAENKGLLNLSNIGLDGSTDSVEAAIMDVKHNERLLSSLEKIDKTFSTDFSQNILSADAIIYTKQLALLSDNTSWKALEIYINHAKELDLSKLFSEKITPALGTDPLSQKDGNSIYIHLHPERSNKVTLEHLYCDEYKSFYRRSIYLEGGDRDDTFKVRVGAERVDCTENARWIRGNAGEDIVEILDDAEKFGRISSITSRRDDGTLNSRFISFNLEESFYDPNNQLENPEGVMVYDDVEEIIFDGKSYSFDDLFSKYETA